MGALACVNGKILSMDDAYVHIEDRGYQLGDGIYEVIISYGKTFFQLQEHLERMERSAKLINLKTGRSVEEIRDMCLHLYEESKIEEAMLYVQLTRGVYPRQHATPAEYEPVLVITVKEKPNPLEEAKVITTEDLRWKLCCVKSTNLLANVLAKDEALEAGCEEPLLIREGRLMEGATTNVFLVKDGIFHTPLADNLILHGITRRVVLEMLEERGRSVEERIIKAQELYQADEVFLSSTVTEITAVLEVDGVTIGDGRPGKETRQLLKEYRELANSKGQR